MGANYTQNVTRSFINLSLAGGEANTLCYQELITDKAGATAQLHLEYELQKDNFIFSVGVGVGYCFTQQMMDSYTDSFWRTTLAGEEIMYNYQYRHYKERQHVADVEIPLRVGYAFGEWVYALLGAKVSVPLWSQYGVDTRLLTEGVYDWAMEPYQNIPELGWYPEQDYTQENTDFNYYTWQIGPSIEIGTQLPLSAKKTQLRIGVFCDYLFPMGKLTRNNLVDYSEVDTNAQTQTQKNLEENIQFNAITTSRLLTTWQHNLQVGIRFTAQFEVTQKKCPCRLAW